MNFKSILAGACTLALVACGDASQSPDVLKGANFVSAQPGVDITLSFDPNEMRVYALPIVRIPLYDYLFSIRPMYLSTSYASID